MWMEALRADPFVCFTPNLYKAAAISYQIKLSNTLKTFFMPAFNCSVVVSVEYRL